MRGGYQSRGGSPEGAPPHQGSAAHRPFPQRSLVTDDVIGDILRRSAEAVEEFGEAKALVEYLEHLEKRRRALILLESTGTLKDREAKAYADDEVHRIAGLRREAITRHERLLAERKHHELTVAVWQSEGSTIRQMTQVR